MHEQDGRTHVAITAVPRFAYTLMAGKSVPPVENAWGEATLKLPEGAPVEFENIFTGERVHAQDGALFCRDLFRSFPFAVLNGM
jgi:hypothetical protein